MPGFDEWLTDDSQPEHKEPYYPSAEPDDIEEGRWAREQNKRATKRK